MAFIKKSITGLKPGSDYLFTLKPKNIEVAATDSEQELIRVTVPIYGQVPQSITGLQVEKNFQTVIIKFDPVNNIDLDYYEYQIYSNAQGLGDPINAKVSSSQDEVLVSGLNKANVFVVSVDNTSLIINPVTQVVTSSITQYWVRVRAVNTSGNPSTSWSDLVASGQLALIADQFIGTLTAAKISAGTIGAHTITLSGANSIIKSSTYSSTAGWQIDGQGNATFNTATLRGQFSSGTSPNWFRVDSSGNIWSGRDTYQNAADTFRVSNAGNLTALSGRVGPFNISSNGISNIGSVGDYSYTNYMRIENYGDITIFSNPNYSPYIDQYHTTSLFGEWVQVTKRSNANWNDSLIEARMGDTYGNNAMEFALVTGGIGLQWRATSDGNTYAAGTSQASTFSGSIGNISSVRGKALNAGNPSNIWTYQGNSSVQIASESGYFDSGYDDHTGYMIGCHMPTGWNNAELYFWNSTNWGEYQNTAFIIKPTSVFAGGYGNISDERMKKNISSSENTLNLLNKLNVKRFTFKNDTEQNKLRYGLIAQNVENIFPDIIHKLESKDFEDGMLSIDSTSLIAILIKSIQELSEKINILEEKNNVY